MNNKFESIKESVRVKFSDVKRKADEFCYEYSDEIIKVNKAMMIGSFGFIAGQVVTNARLCKILKDLGCEINTLRIGLQKYDAIEMKEGMLLIPKLFRK